MSEFNLVYKWSKPEGFYGCRCKVISTAAADRVLLLFEDGRKLMRSKFAVTSAAKFAQIGERKKPNRIRCEHCDGKGWIPSPQVPLSLESQDAEEF